jgi:subtilisin family serine protease
MTGSIETSLHQERLAADKALQYTISAVTRYVLLELEGFSYEVNHTFSTIPFLALTVSEEALDNLFYSPEVLFVLEDRFTLLNEVQKVRKDNIAVPNLNQSRKIVGAEGAWSSGFTGEGWYVAVLDTGILRTHEMFTGKEIVEQCYSVLKDCPNGKNEMSGPGSASHKYTSFGYDHGSHVTGIATGNNKKGFSGIAKDADIIACQIFSGPIHDYGAYDSDQTKALEFVYLKRTTYKIASVNMSIGGGRYSSNCDNLYSPIKTAMKNLRDVGIATVVATGNNGDCGAIDAPACISSAIAIGATTENDNECTFNNWHDDLLDFFAPGQDIRSARGNYNTSYASWNGTSMATPHVAGAWAIIKQVIPNASVSEIYQALAETGTMIQSKCYNSNVSKPRINIDKAINLLGYSLTISAGMGGTTDPSPGTYSYDKGKKVTITAISNENYGFAYWSGDASGTNNPITITMDSNKSIKANFIRQYDLTINASTGGTTNPSPGTYSYDKGKKVTLTAISDENYVFSHWSGAVSRTNNPTTITMNMDKSITATFRPINPPADFSGTKSTNRNLFQIEYVNTLNWKTNPYNQGINIAKYRIYLIDGGSSTQLVEVDNNTFTYLHRRAGKDPQKYAIVCVLNNGRIGFASIISVQ